MRKKLRMRVFAIATVCALCLSGTGNGLQVVYADTEDVEVEEDVTFEEGYVSEDGKWNCTLVKHDYVSDGEGWQVVEISLESYREKLEIKDSKMTIPEKMKVRYGETGDLIGEYYVTRIGSMDTNSTKWTVDNATSVTIPQTVISIGDDAFKYMDCLEEVTISPATDDGAEQAVLESYWLDGAGIGDRAFYKCEKLKSVEIPSNIQEIGMSAFADCGRLESINLPNGVARIGEWAFANCAFTEISLPDSITKIDNHAFYGCERLAAIEFPPELTELSTGVVGDCKALTEITVPSKVTMIGGSAFNGCTNLEKITFGDAPIDTIGDAAFYQCQNLTDISLPDTVTEIGSSAFYNCKSLTSLRLPEHLTEVPSGCFSSCEKLTSVVVPNSVEKIGSQAFYTCTSLETVVIPKNAKFEYLDFVFNGCYASILTIYTEEDSYLLENLEKDINLRCIPVHGAVSAVLETEDGWKYMKDEEEGIKIVDYDGESENLVIPEFPDAAVTSISGRIWQESIWQEITAVKSIQIPDTVTYIGADAFNGCGLTAINLPSGLTYIGDNALKGSGTITNKSMPENLRYIGDYAFCGWTELEKAVIPANVEWVGSYAFDGCTKLGSVEFKEVPEMGPEEGFYIGTAAFRNCDLKSLTLPDNCSAINGNAFEGNKNLTTVVLPDRMDYISDRVFADCYALEHINLPSGLACISEYLFKDCGKVSGIIIPEGVESIQKGAFSGCTSLTGINVPETVTTIESYAFSGCTGISEITIPKDVTFIGTEAFSGCTGISEITIPEAVTRIGTEAFNGCSSLTKATIPSKTTLVRDDAFTGCPALTIYTVSDSDALRYAKEHSIPYVLLDGGEGGNNKPATPGGNEGDDNNKPATPGGSEGDNNKPATPGGSEDDNNKPATPGGSEDDDNNKPATPGGTTKPTPAAKGKKLTVTNLKCTVKVTSANKENPQVAYIGTTNKKATQIKVPDTVSVNGVTYKVTSIADKAFYKNKKIKTVTVGKNVTSIGKGAFQNCTNLTTVTIKSTAFNKIGANAFDGDKKLTKITLKTTKLTKKSIGKNALKGTNKKLIIKVPSNKVSAYKGYFKNKGNKNVKVKK